MWGTRSRKLVKRHTPFASKRTVRDALDRTFAHFRDATLVVSYGSNAALGVEELEALLRRHAPRVAADRDPAHVRVRARHAAPGASGRGAPTEYVARRFGPPKAGPQVTTCATPRTGTGWSRRRRS